MRLSRQVLIPVPYEARDGWDTGVGVGDTEKVKEELELEPSPVYAVSRSVPGSIGVEVDAGGATT